METKQSKMFSRIKELISPWHVIYAVFIAYLCHGAMLFSDTIGIDTEKAILDSDAYATQGRAGVIWIRNLLKAGNFNLYYEEGLTFALLVVSPFVFLTIFYFISKDLGLFRKVIIPFLTFWIISPFWVAQLYFLSQSVPVMVTLILLPIAAWLVNMSVDNLKKWWGLLIAVAIIYLSLNVYQMQIVIYALCVLVIFYFRNRENNYSFKGIIKWIVINAGVILGAMVIYLIISKLFFFAGESYLTSQISWTHVGIKQGIIGIVVWFINSCRYPSFSKVFVPACFLLLLFSGLNMFARKNDKKVGNRLFLLFVEMLICIIPYVFVIFYGNGISPRMCYPFPVTEAVVILLLVKEILLFVEAFHINKKRVLGIISKGILVIMLLIMVKDVLNLWDYSNKMYYTENYVYRQDVEISKNVKNEIEHVINENGYDRQDAYEHLIFLGTPPITYNDSCWPGCGGATIGGSFWEWDHTYSMYRYRIYPIMELNGYGINHAVFSDGAQMAYYYYFEDFFGEAVTQMPAYPNEGYVQYLQDESTGLKYFVVKLGYNWKDEMEQNREQMISQLEN